MNAVDSHLPVLLEHHADDRASGLQIAATAVAAIFILGVFFYGISNQRSETGQANNQKMAATPVEPSAQPTPQQGESGKSTQPPNSQQQANKQNGNQNQQPANQASANKAQQANPNGAQAPGRSSTTGQNSSGQSNGANGKAASQPETPPAKQPQSSGAQ